MKKDALTLNLSEQVAAALKPATVQRPAPTFPCARDGTPGSVPPDGPLASPDLGLLELASPKLKLLIIQSNGLVTTTRQARNSSAPRWWSVKNSSPRACQGPGELAQVEPAGFGPGLHCSSGSGTLEHGHGHQASRLAGSCSGHTQGAGVRESEQPPGQHQECRVRCDRYFSVQPMPSHPPSPAQGRAQG